MLKPYRTKLLPARLKIEVGDAAKGEADALVVPAYQGERKHEILFDRTKARGVLSHLKAPDFKAGPKDGVLLRTLGRLPAPRLLVLGVGRPKEVGADRLRDFAGRAASKLKGKNVRRVAIDVPSRTGVSVDTAVEVMAEGALLALFEVEDFRKRNPEVVAKARESLRAMDHMAFAATSRSISQIDFVDTVKRITSPTLILVGSHDQGTPVSAAEKMKGLITGSQMHVIQGAQHDTISEQPERIASLVLEFLGGVKEKR